MVRNQTILCELRELLVPGRRVSSPAPSSSVFVDSGHRSRRREADLGQLDVERLPVVVEGRGL